MLERQGVHSVNLSFGESQSTSSKQSMGFGAVQSMDGRRKKSKTKRQPPTYVTSSFNDSLRVAVGVKKIIAKSGVKGASKKQSQQNA